MSNLKSAVKESVDKASEGGAGVLQVYLFGLVIVIGGQYIVWNSGLEAGFYTFLFCTLFLGCGYVCLSLCLSEMIGILPFGGGAYGFARLTLGPTFGYLIGCCESIESILYVTAAVVPLGRLITSLFNISSVFEPLWWFLFYFSAVCLQCSGNTVFWVFNVVMGVTVLALVLVYCFGSIPNIDYPQYVTHQNQYLTEERGLEVRIYEMMENLPLAGWWYVGVEGLPLVCNKAREATTTVPRAIMLCVATSLLTAVGILFCCSAQYPGVYQLVYADHLDVYLMDYGFSAIFHISHRFAGVLSIPAIYSTAYGFMFIYGTQMSAMAKSGLFPRGMAATAGPSEAPYMALIAGSVVGFVILIAIRFVDQSLTDHLFNVSMLGSFFVYMSLFTSYVIFKTQYTTLTRNFVNPLGVYSAYLGTFVFCVAFIAVCAFQQDNHAALVAFIIMISCFYLYYWLVAKKRQFYSPDEQGILLITYIIKGNMLKKRRRSSMGSSTPQITRSNQSTPQPQHRELPVFDFRSTPVPALKEEDGVVPFTDDAEEDVEMGVLSVKSGKSGKSSKSGKSGKFKRGDTFDPAEAADMVMSLKQLYGGGLASIAPSGSADTDDFENTSVSVNTQINQLSISSLLFAQRKTAHQHWQQAKGVVSIQRMKPSPARTSLLFQKRKPQMKYREMLEHKHDEGDGHHRHHRHHRHQYSGSKSGSKNGSEDSKGIEVDEEELNQRVHHPTLLIPEAEESTNRIGRNTGTRGSGSMRSPFLGAQISHWFTNSRRVGDLSMVGSSWYLEGRSSHSSSASSSMSMRIISRLSSSLSSINLVNHVDTLVSAHHDSVVQNVINILPSHSSDNFDGIVEAIVDRMLQEKDLDQEAFDVFLDSLGNTMEARVIAVKYQDELARRGRKLMPATPTSAVAAAAMAQAASEIAAVSRESV